MAEENKDFVVPEKFKDIVEKVEKMTVIELSELVKTLEGKFGVSATPTFVGGAAPAAGAATEEKSEFTVVLAGPGDKKIEVIKAVRDATQKGLKEAKDLVDASEKAPQVLAENVKKEQAEAMKKAFETAGAKIELK